MRFRLFGTRSVHKQSSFPQFSRVAITHTWYFSCTPQLPEGLLFWRKRRPSQKREGYRRQTLGQSSQRWVSSFFPISACLQMFLKRLRNRACFVCADWCWNVFFFFFLQASMWVSKKNVLDISTYQQGMCQYNISFCSYDSQVINTTLNNAYAHWFYDILSVVNQIWIWSGIRSIRVSNEGIMWRDEVSCSAQYILH